MFTRTLAGLLLLVGAVSAEKAPPLKASYTADKVAGGVYVIHGPLGMPNPENQGFMNNPGFVLTSAGVVIVDPGASVQTGEMVLGQIKKVTDKPVVAVFDTHVHGDHWLGNQAVREAYPDVPIYGHPKMISRVDQGDGITWMERMLELTQGATAGTEVINASSPVDDKAEVKIGDVTFRIIHNGKAHTDNDIMLLLPERGVIFLGDNAGHGRILRQTGAFQGNIEALNLALATDAKVFIPGHGKTAGQEAASSYRDYLKTLYDGVNEYFEEDIPDFEIKPKLRPRLAKWQDWEGFDNLMGNHVSQAYLEIEEAAF